MSLETLYYSITTVSDQEETDLSWPNSLRKVDCLSLCMKKDIPHDDNVYSIVQGSTMAHPC